MTTQVFDLYPLFWWQNPWYVGGILLLVLICIGGIIGRYLYVKKKKQKILSCGEIRALIKKISEKSLATIDEQKDAYTQSMRLLKVFIYSQKELFPFVHDIDEEGGNLTDQETIFLFLQKEHTGSSDIIGQIEQIAIDSYKCRFGGYVFAQEHVKQQLRVLYEALHVYEIKNKNIHPDIT